MCKEELFIQQNELGLPVYTSWVLGLSFSLKKNTVHSCYIWMVICMCSWVSVSDFYVWKWLVMSGFFLAGCIIRILGILVVLCIVRITQHLSSFEEKLPPPPPLIGYSLIFILVGYLRFKCFNYLVFKFFIRVSTSPTYSAWHFLYY